MEQRTHVISIPQRRTIGALAFCTALVLAGCGPSGGDAPSSAPGSASAQVAPSASAEPSGAARPSSSEAPAAGEEVSIFDVEEGDCFDADGDELESVTVVPCEASHTYEAFHVFDHEAGADAEYPGDDPMTEYAETECAVPFEDYVGHPYDTSIWYISWITPSEGTWADGDREILCTVHQQNEAGDAIQVTGSAEGSGE